MENDHVEVLRRLLQRIAELIEETKSDGRPTRYLEYVQDIFKRVVELQMGSPPRSPAQIWAAHEMVAQRRSRRPDAYSGKDFNPNANYGRC
jgi:hypothetical protein